MSMLLYVYVKCSMVQAGTFCLSVLCVRRVYVAGRVSEDKGLNFHRVFEDIFGSEDIFAVFGYIKPLVRVASKVLYV